MGLFGGDSSSSSNTTKISRRITRTKTQTETQNQALSDIGGEALALAGSDNTLNVTDGGAFELAESVMSGTASLISDLAENQVEVMGSANQLAQTALANVASANGVEPVTVEGQKERTKMYVGLAAAGAVAVVGASYFFGGGE